MLAAFALPSELDSKIRRRQIRRTLERASGVPTEITERGNCNLRGDAFPAATLAVAAARVAVELHDPVRLDGVITIGVDEHACSVAA